MFNNIYKNKRVLITGHTGFKGSWLALWLSMLGADVLGYSLAPNTVPSLYETLNLQSDIKNVCGDIRDKEYLCKIFNEFKPEIVFHLAAQPIVRLSYEEPVLTFETNVLGTLNTLEAARKCQSVKAFVNVTSDKCYENKEIDYGYKETDPMGGYDIYSSSKGCSELLTASYRKSFLQDGVPFALASARAGNVIGGGDWAQDRLVPDCVRCLVQNKPISIRNPISIRPWQHVLEPLSGYLRLGEKLLCRDGNIYAEGFNFGPNNDCVLTVEDLVKKAIQNWGQGEVIVEKTDNLHEANLLRLNIEKAEKILNWKPVYTVDNAIKLTIDWYKNFYAGTKMKDFTIEQIMNYSQNLEEMVNLCK